VKHYAERLFGIGTQLAETLITRLKNPHISSEKADYQRAMLFFFCRAYKSYRAIVLLYKSGYVEDATSLARSIYELRVQVRWMSDDPLSRGKLFIDHWFTSGFGTLQILRRHHPGNRRELDTGERQMRIGAGRERLHLFQDPVGAERSVRGNWWGGGGIRRLLEDLHLVNEYDVIYSQLSDYTHSGVRLLHQYTRVSEDSLSMFYRPMMRNSKTVPWSTTDWLSQIVGFTARAFELDFDDIVTRAQQKARTVHESTERDLDKE